MSIDPNFEEKYKKLWAEIEALPPEQQQQLQEEAMDALLRRRRVEVDGKVTSLRNLRRRVEEQRRLFESGAYDETVRSLPRWQVQELTPGSEIRQGAYKQQLRWREEAELELDRFGNGNVFSPHPVLGTLFKGRRDFAWGIFARSNEAEQALQSSWAGREPSRVLADETFFTDMIRHCYQLELTLMALTTRSLPLAATRQQMAAKLESSMQRLAGGELSQQDRSDLQDFCHMFDDERVSEAGWMDRKGCVKQGTHFIFSTTPKGELAVEAITPGRLKDRKTSYIGVNRSQLITASFFDMFLGPEPLDAFGKKSVGRGMLFVANGFRFRPWEMRPGQYIAEEGPDGQLSFPQPDPESVEKMQLPLRPSVFQLLEQQTKPLRRMLLRDIRRAQRRPSAAVAAVTEG